MKKFKVKSPKEIIGQIVLSLKMMKKLKRIISYKAWTASIPPLTKTTFSTIISKNNQHQPNKEKMKTQNFYNF